MSENTPTISVGTEVKIKIPVSGAEQKKIFNKDTSDTNVAKSQKVLAQEAEQKERQRIILSREQQEAVDNARAVYQDVLPSAAKRQTVEGGKIETDQLLPQPRTYAEKLIHEWAKRVNSGTGSPVAIELGNTTNQGLIVEAGKDNRWHVILPSLDSEPPTLKQLSLAIQKIAREMDDIHGMDGMQAAQTEIFAQDLEEVTRDSAQSTNSTIADATIQELNTTAEEIRNAIHEQYGSRIPGMQVKTRGEIASQASTTPTARQEVVKRLTQEVQELLVQKNAAEQLESNKSTEPVNFTLQVLMQEARFMAGDDISFIPSTTNEVTITRTPDGKKTIISMPEHPTLDTVVQLAREYARLSSDASTTGRIESFSQRLQDTALLMAQQGFSDEAIVSVYTMGQRLQASLHPEDASLTQPRTAEQIHAEVARRIGENERQNNRRELFTADEQRDIYMDMLYGRGVVLTVNGRTRESFYERQFPTWQADALQRDPNADISRAAYAQSLMQRLQENDRYSALVKRAVEKSIRDGATGRAAVAGEQVALQRAQESITRAQVNEWVDAVQKFHTSEAFNQKWQEALVKEAISKKEGEGLTTEERLHVITRLLQSGEIVDELKYLPADILEALKQDPETANQYLVAMACNLKSAELLKIAESDPEMQENVGVIEEGNHVWLVIKIGEEYIEIDASTPEQMARKGITEHLSGMTKLVDDGTKEAKARIERAQKAIANRQNNKQIIIATMYTNAAALTPNEGVKRALLLQAVNADPNNAMAWYSLEKAKAIALDPFIENKWNATEGKIGRYTPSMPISALDLLDIKNEIDTELGIIPTTKPSDLTELDSRELRKYLLEVVKAQNKNNKAAMEDARKAAAAALAGTPFTPDANIIATTTESPFMIVDLQNAIKVTDAKAEWANEERENFQFLLEAQQLRKLRAYPKAFMDEQLDQIYQAVAQGQSAESQGVGDLLGVIGKGIYYLNTKGRQQEAFQMQKDKNTITNTLFTRSAFGSRSAENITKTGSQLGAQGLLDAYALDGGAVAQLHNRFLELLEDRRLREDPQKQFVHPQMIDNTIKDLQREQELLSRKGIGAFGGYRAVVEAFALSTTDPELIYKEIQKIKIGPRPRGSTASPHDAIYTQYGVYDDRFEPYIRDLERAARYDFILPGETAATPADAKAARIAKIKENLEKDITAATLRVVLTAVDVAKVDQRMFVIVARLKDHLKNDSAWRSDPTSIFSIFNPEDLGSDKWMSLSASQLQLLEVAKIKRAESYVTKYNVAGIGENDRGAQLRLGKLLLKDIIPAPDYYSSAWKNLYLLDQWENIFIYKAVLREHIANGHANGFDGMTPLDVQTLVDGWKLRNPGAEKAAVSDYEGNPTKHRRGITKFDQLNTQEKLQIINDWRNSSIYIKNDLDIARENANDFALHMRFGQNPEDRLYRTMTYRETWEKVKTFSPQVIIRLYQERNVLLLDGEPGKDCLDGLNRQLAAATSGKTADRVTNYNDFQRLYSSAISQVQEAAMRPHNAADDPRRINFAALLPADEAAINAVLAAEGKTGSAAELQVLVQTMQDYIDTNNLITPLIQGNGNNDAEVKALGPIKREDAFRFVDLYKRTLQIDDIALDLLEQPDNLSHDGKTNLLQLPGVSTEWGRSGGDRGGDLYLRALIDSTNASETLNAFYEFLAGRTWEDRNKALPAVMQGLYKVGGVPDKLTMYRDVVIPLYKAARMPMLADALGVDNPWFRQEWTKLQKIMGTQEQGLHTHQLRAIVDQMRPDLIGAARAMPENTPEEREAKAQMIKEAEEIFHEVEKALDIGWTGFFKRKAIGVSLLSLLLGLAETVTVAQEASAVK